MSEETIYDELLGELDTDTWTGYFQLKSGQRFSFGLLGLQDLAITRQIYRDTLDLIQREDENLRRHAAEDMVDLYNNIWRNPDDEIIDIPTFVKQIETINSVTLYKEPGRADIYYENDDLFNGHVIHVELRNGFYHHAGLAG